MSDALAELREALTSAHDELFGCELNTARLPADTTDLDEILDMAGRHDRAGDLLTAALQSLPAIEQAMRQQAEALAALSKSHDELADLVAGTPEHSIGAMARAEIARRKVAALPTPPKEG